MKVRASEHQVRCANMCGAVLHWWDFESGSSPGLMLDRGWVLRDGLWFCPNCPNRSPKPVPDLK